MLRVGRRFFARIKYLRLFPLWTLDSPPSGPHATAPPLRTPVSADLALEGSVDSGLSAISPCPRVEGLGGVLRAARGALARCAGAARRRAARGAARGRAARGAARGAASDLRPTHCTGVYCTKVLYSATRSTRHANLAHCRAGPNCCTCKNLRFVGGGACGVPQQTDRYYL